MQDGTTSCVDGDWICLGDFRGGLLIVLHWQKQNKKFGLPSDIYYLATAMGNIVRWNLMTDSLHSRPYMNAWICRAGYAPAPFDSKPAITGFMASSLPSDLSHIPNSPTLQSRYFGYVSLRISVSQTHEQLSTSISARLPITSTLRDERGPGRREYMITATVVLSHTWLASVSRIKQQ